MYAPLAYGPRFDAQATNGRRSEFLRVIGRAVPGASEAAVNADLARVGQQLQQAFPQTNQRLTFGGTPVLDLLVGEARTPLLMLFAAVALVLLVACANVANLLLARGSARRSELAVRAALGAGRGRLVRQLVAEALLLGIVGGAIGVLLAYAGVRALVWAQPADIPRLDDVAVNGVVVGFTFVCAIVTALVFGVIPALQSTGHDLLQYVRAGGRGGDGGGRRLRSGLVVAETALAVVLLVGAGLLVRSLGELAKVNPGFVPERALSLRVLLQGPAYAELPGAAAARPGHWRQAASASWRQCRRRHRRAAVERPRGHVVVRRRRCAAAASRRQRRDCGRGYRAGLPSCRRRDAAARAWLHRRRQPPRRGAGRDHQRSRRAALVS